jgi:hypothetical protein
MKEIHEGVCGNHSETQMLAHKATRAVIIGLWRSIVCQFRIPHAFVTDNGTQFDCKQFREWCSELQIRNYYSSILCLKANGQVEATNKTLMRMLKKMLQQKKWAWVEYVPKVLWSYHTTTRTLTGDTCFSFTYGTEVVIPVEVGSPSFKVASYNPGLNDEGINLNLDLLQEKKEEMMIRLPGQTIMIERLGTSTRQ